MSFYSETCSRLEIFRLDRNMSYRRLAMYLELDHTLVYRWCRQQRVPSVKWRLFLFEKTKIPVSYWSRYDKK